MIHRYVEDFQNGKKVKGIEEVKQRYQSVQGRVDLDSDGDEDNSAENIHFSVVRKPPRKKNNPTRKDQKPLITAAGVSTKRKKEIDQNVTPAPKNARRALFSQDADMNEPYDMTKTKISPGFTKFSKNKQVRNLQIAKLKKLIKIR